MSYFEDDHIWSHFSWYERRMAPPSALAQQESTSVSMTQPEWAEFRAFLSACSPGDVREIGALAIAESLTRVNAT